MRVFEAVERDIERLGSRAQESSLAAVALSLAEQVDGRNSATSKSMCAKELRETLRELRLLVPEQEEPDRVDDIQHARERRLAGRTAA